MNDNVIDADGDYVIKARGTTFGALDLDCAMQSKICEYRIERKVGGNQSSIHNLSYDDKARPPVNSL